MLHITSCLFLATTGSCCVENGILNKGADVPPYDMRLNTAQILLENNAPLGWCGIWAQLGSFVPSNANESII
jgi:hypothetical protein